MQLVSAGEAPIVTGDGPRRPILAGNGLGGVYVLDLLIEAYPPEDLLVIAPSETERHDWQPSLADWLGNGPCPSCRPERVNDPEVLEQIAEHDRDLLLSVFYTQIFRPSCSIRSTGRRSTSIPRCFRATVVRLR